MTNVHIVIRVGGSVPKATALALPTATDLSVPTTVVKPYWMIWEDSGSEGGPAEVKFTTVEPDISGLQELDSIGTALNVAEQPSGADNAPSKVVANSKLDMLFTQSQALTVVVQALTAQIETLQTQLESMEPSQ